MAYEVLVLDVDGTLVNSKKEITKATKEAVIQCQQNGIKVVICLRKMYRGNTTSGRGTGTSKLWRLYSFL